MKLTALLVVLLAASHLAPARQTAQTSVPFRELQSYKKAGQMWRNIVVDPKIKRDDLIKLARELHAAHPDTRFRIFTDDKEFNAFMLRDQNYPDPAYTYPEKWAKKHYVAIINKMFTETGQRWQLYPTGDLGFKFVAKGGSVIADLE